MLNFSDNKPDRKEIIWNYFPKKEWDRFISILDCASGDGRKGMQYYIANGLNPYRVHAVDTNLKSLRVLKKLGVKIYCENLEHRKPSAFLSPHIDLIICAETLEHLTQKCEDNLLISFMHVLKKDGHLVITFPVNAVSPKNLTHIRQPSYSKILKVLMPLFQNVEMSKFGSKNYMMFFTGKLK